VSSFKVKMEKRMKSSATEMMDEPLMIPSQPPILAEKCQRKSVSSFSPKYPGPMS
jgi:hypothetical protein